MIQVEIRKIDKDGNDVSEGTITFDGKGYCLEPADSRLLHRILNAPIHGKHGIILDKSRPRDFLRNLCRQYKSAYLRATEAADDSEAQLSTDSVAGGSAAVSEKEGKGIDMSTFRIGKQTLIVDGKRVSRKIITLPLELATAHAPAGKGIDIGDRHFEPGEFIPGNALAQATPEQKAQLNVKGSGSAPGEGQHTSKLYTPDPTAPNAVTGIPDHARVGVPAMESPPPPNSIPRLPNLSKKQRKVESRFADAYLKDPDKFAKHYLKALRKRKVGEYPNVFATDDVKSLNPDWNPVGPELGAKLSDEQKKAMAKYNAAVHQTANAIAKRAFLRYLDETVSKLPPDKRTVLVTNGGCASGKGSTLARSSDPKDPHFGMLPAAEQVGAIYDSAGEQNATENPWLLEECKKRGITPIFAYVHADPKTTWDAEDRGVIRRAVRKGRMVDARLFADSYALGAKNMKAFADKHKDDAQFIFLDNRDKAAPKRLDAFPDEALQWDSETIYRDALAALHRRKDELSPALVKGGMAGVKIWGPPKSAGSESG